MAAVSSLTFKRIVTIVNPRSTHAAAALRRQKKIESLFPEAKKLHIELSKNQKSIKDLLIARKTWLGTKTLLCIAGGDGTINTVIEALLKEESLKKVRRTPILPLWGGNGNDLAVMLNGLALTTSVSKIFSDGKVKAIYPLECIVEHDAATVTYLAANYISFGASAYTAKRLNESSHRNSWLHHFPGGRYIKEIMTTMKAFFESPTFSILESGRVRPTYERIYANGSRIARINSLPVKLTDEAFYHIRLETRHPLTFFRHLLDVLTRRRTTPKSRKASFTVATLPIFAQFDGEAVSIPQGAKITIRFSRRPFYALTTRL